MKVVEEARNFEKLISLGEFLTRVKNGYLQFFENGKWVWVHRKIAEIQSGIIPEGHEVHHINGNKTDNRPENLQILSKEEHRAIHRKYIEDEVIKEVYSAIMIRLTRKARFNAGTYYKSGCSKCGGSGYLPEFSYHMGGICFLCMGSG